MWTEIMCFLYSIVLYSKCKGPLTTIMIKFPGYLSNFLIKPPHKTGGWLVLPFQSRFLNNSVKRLSSHGLSPAMNPKASCRVRALVLCQWSWRFHTTLSGIFTGFTVLLQTHWFTTFLRFHCWMWPYRDAELGQIFIFLHVTITGSGERRNLVKTYKINPFSKAERSGLLFLAKTDNSFQEVTAVSL